MRDRCWSWAGIGGLESVEKKIGCGDRSSIRGVKQRALKIFGFWMGRLKSGWVRDEGGGFFVAEGHILNVIR